MWGGLRRPMIGPFQVLRIGRGGACRSLFQLIRFHAARARAAIVSPSSSRPAGSACRSSPYYRCLRPSPLRRSHSIGLLRHLHRPGRTSRAAISRAASTDGSKRGEALMSTPIRNEDGVDDPSIYTPRWARSSQPDRPALASYANAPPTSPETKPGTTNALRAAAISQAAASITQTAFAKVGQATLDC